jgi:hypothetical protein
VFVDTAGAVLVVILLEGFPQFRRHGDLIIEASKTATWAQSMGISNGFGKEI